MRKIIINLLFILLLLGLAAPGCQTQELDLALEEDVSSKPAPTEDSVQEEEKALPPSIPWQGIKLPLLEEVGPQETLPTLSSELYAPLYVNPGKGSDVQGTGSRRNPFRSLEKALSLLDRQGESLILISAGDDPSQSPLTIPEGVHIVCEKGVEIQAPILIKNSSLGKGAASLHNCSISYDDPSKPAIVIQGSATLSHNTILKNNEGLSIEGGSDLEVELSYNSFPALKIARGAGDLEGPRVTVEKNFITHSVYGVTCTDCGSFVSVTHNIIQISSEEDKDFQGGAAFQIQTSYNQESHPTLEGNIIWLDPGAAFIEQQAFAESPGNPKALGEATAGAPASVSLNTIYAVDAFDGHWLYRGFTSDLGDSGEIYEHALDVYVSQGSPLWRLNQDPEVKDSASGLHDNIFIPPPTHE